MMELSRLLLLAGIVLVHSRSVPDSDPASDESKSDPGLDEPWLADFDGGNSHGYVVSVLQSIPKWKHINLMIHFSSSLSSVF